MPPFLSPRTVYLYWLVVYLFLAASLLVWRPALLGAILVVMISNFHLILRNPLVDGFSLQVRFVFTALLIVGLVPGYQWIHWVQLVGTTALLTVGYCPLARLLALAPWNRERPLSWQLFKRVFFSSPTRGSVVSLVSK